MKLELTQAALDDLRSIRAYTMERWGPVQEQRYLDQIWGKFETISTDPSKFRFRRDLFPGCQIAAEGKHVILFRMHKAGSGDSSHEDAEQAERNRFRHKSTLQVVRVLHGAMDFKRHIPPAARTGR